MRPASQAVSIHLLPDGRSSSSVRQGSPFSYCRVVVQLFLTLHLWCSNRKVVVHIDIFRMEGWSYDRSTQDAVHQKDVCPIVQDFGMPSLPDQNLKSISITERLKAIIKYSWTSTDQISIIVWHFYQKLKVTK